MLVADDLQFCNVPSSCERWVAVKVGRPACVFMSCYTQHGSGAGLPQVERAMMEMRGCMVLGGDFYRHNPLVRPYSKAYSLGTRVEETLALGGLTIYNDPNSPPTFENSMGHASWVDITARSPCVEVSN